MSTLVAASASVCAVTVTVGSRVVVALIVAVATPPEVRALVVVMPLSTNTP